MKVFKFGGASIKNAAAVKNMTKIVRSYSNEKLLVVVSAMGKTTNALEDILSSRLATGELDLVPLKKYHIDICNDLFYSEHQIFQQIESLFDHLHSTLEKDYPFDKYYDQVISFGEILSSTIISEYLNEIGCSVKLIDSRKYVRTDSNFRNGHVDWDITCDLISDLNDDLNNHTLLTQGFIGGTAEGLTTTLGREGSDFTAAIYAHCLNAESMTVWKDVPGILNADPKIISDAKLFNEIPYSEAAEMTYYGASVIHPKTIKPLANKNIPLFVRSFDSPENNGTIIHQCDFKNPNSTIIIKNDQCLVSFHVIDYTFVNEDNLSLIFKELHNLDIKINIMQNSAISFSIVIDYRKDKLEALISVLNEHFDIRYNTGLSLITIKNYSSDDIDKYRKGKRILLEQQSRNNYRALYASSEA